MNAAIAKKLQLIAEWDDRGYNKGVEKGKVNTEQLKKRAKELAMAFIAVGTALVGVTAGLVKFIKTGAQVKSVADSFWGFVENANMGADTLDRVNLILGDTVRDMDIMQASTQALAAGLEPERLEEFWGKAKQMADVMSKDTLEVFQNLVSGYTKLETETLKTIGITVRADDVYREYALSINKTAAALTTAERRTAFYIALHEKYMKGFYSVGDVTTRNRELFQKLEKKLKDTWDRLNEMVALSPAVQGFLEMMIEKADNLGQTLEENGPAIEGATEDLIGLANALFKLGKFTIDHGDEILTFMAALAATKVVTWAVGLGNALGLLGVSAAAAGGWAGLIVAAVILIANNYKTVVDGFLELWDTFNRFVWGILDLILYGVEMALRGLDKIPGVDVSGLLGNVTAAREKVQEEIFGKTFIDGLQDKVAEWPEFNVFDLLMPKDKQEIEITPPDEGREIGGTNPILPEPLEDWEAAHEIQVNSYIAAELEKADGHIDIMTDLTDTLNDIDATRSSLYWERMEADTEGLRRHQAMRVAAYQRGYQVMGFYSSQFFRHGAHMGRVMNAMLIAGFTEMVASYIDAKSAQAKLDAMEYSYQAIAAVARQDWVAASAFGVAAARAGAQAGVAVMAAGYIRSYGQEKAEAMTQEQDDFGDDPYSEDVDGRGQRQKAAGVVSQRPVHLTVVATHNIKAGLIVFPDGSEEAAEQFYQTYTRDNIQADIEAGAIVLPA